MCDFRRKARRRRGRANVCVLLCVEEVAKDDGGFRCVMIGGRRGGKEDGAALYESVGQEERKNRGRSACVWERRTQAHRLSDPSGTLI